MLKALFIVSGWFKSRDRHVAKDAPEDPFIFCAVGQGFIRVPEKKEAKCESQSESAASAPTPDSADTQDKQAICMARLSPVSVLD